MELSIKDQMLMEQVNTILDKNIYSITLTSFDPLRPYNNLKRRPTFYLTLLDVVERSTQITQICLSIFGVRGKVGCGLRLAKLPGMYYMV